MRLVGRFGMPIVAVAAVFVLSMTLSVVPASARPLCTLISDLATGVTVHEEGDCDTRRTPASTFKVPLAVMGFDAGVLQDAHSPVLPFEKGYPDWVAAWRQSTDPAAWMKNSVLWYSQQVAKALGRERFVDYLRRFSYGNEDASGDPGENNALERSWVGSSLKISPREQTKFVAALVKRELPVSRSAMDMTDLIVEQRRLDSGWTMRGKTGSAYPRRADGSFDRDRMWGWYVGWAELGGRTLVFARLNQDETRQKEPGGLRARDEFLREFSSLVR